MGVPYRHRACQPLSAAPAAGFSSTRLPGITSPWIQSAGAPHAHGIASHTPHPHSCHHRCIEALGLHALVCDGSIRQRHTLSTMAVPELSEAARSHYEAALAKHAPSTEFRTGNARVTAWLHEDPPSQERLANVRVFYCDGTVWRCCCGQSGSLACLLTVDSRRNSRSEAHSSHAD